MQQIKKYVFVILTAVLFISCSEDEPEIDPTGECITVRLMESLCGKAVLQIQSPEFYAAGESANGYKNVFLTTIHCDDVMDPTEIFRVTITDDDDKGDCAVCTAELIYNGKKHYDVRVVDSCGNQ